MSRSERGTCVAMDWFRENDSQGLRLFIIFNNGLIC